MHANHMSELRNRIYEMAINSIDGRIAPTWPRGKPSKRKRSKPSSTSPQDDGDRYQMKMPIPYLGLTQVCSLIRTEFRPMWLNTHRFPLFAVDPYLKTFFPLPTPSTDRKRLDSYNDPSGTLHIIIRNNDLADTDILKLLKHKARYPSYNFRPIPAPHETVDEPTISSIAALINNTSPAWIKWIKGNVVTQFRLKCNWRGYADAGKPLRVVIKERHAPAWMKPTLNADKHVPPGYLEKLGLSLVTGWKVWFGVDYF